MSGIVFDLILKTDFLEEDKILFEMDDFFGFEKEKDFLYGPKAFKYAYENGIIDLSLN